MRRRVGVIHDVTCGGEGVVGFLLLRIWEVELSCRTSADEVSI